jgi:hypothetical protein
MCFSVFLAMVIGFYFTLTSLAYLIHKDRYKKALLDFTSDHPLMAISSEISTLLGLLIVVSHNIWSCNWRVLVTLTGWFLLVEGVLRLFFPERMTKLLKHMASTSGYVIFMTIWLVIGLYLLFIAFF